MTVCDFRSIMSDRCARCGRECFCAHHDDDDPDAPTPLVTIEIDSSSDSDAASSAPRAASQRVWNLSPCPGCGRVCPCEPVKAPYSPRERAEAEVPQAWDVCYSTLMRDAFAVINSTTRRTTPRGGPAPPQRYKFTAAKFTSSD